MNTKGKMKRLLAIMVCLMMVFMSIPASAFATDEIEGSDPIVTEGGDSGDSGDIPPSDLPPSDPGDAPPSDPGDLSGDEDPTLPDGGEGIDPVVLPQANPGGMGPMMTELVTESIEPLTEEQKQARINELLAQLHEKDGHQDSPNPGPDCNECAELTELGFDLPANINSVYKGEDSSDGRYAGFKKIDSGASSTWTFKFTENVSASYVVIKASKEHYFVPAAQYFTQNPNGEKYFIAGVEYTVANTRITNNKGVLQNISHLCFVPGSGYVPPAGAEVKVVKNVDYGDVDTTGTAPEKEFTFVLVDDRNDEVAKATITINGWEAAAGPATFAPKVADGTYTMYEEGDDNDTVWGYSEALYTVVITDGVAVYYLGEGTDTPITTDCPEFTNTYNGSTDESTFKLRVQKTITKNEGVAAPKGPYTFTFKVYDFTDEIKGTEALASAAVNFGKGNFGDTKKSQLLQWDGMDEGTYLIEEFNDEVAGWDYDASQYKVEVTKKANGKYAVTYQVRASENDEWTTYEGKLPAFENNYQGIIKTELEVKGIKSVVHDIDGDHTPADADMNKEFTFNLMNKNMKKVIATATVSSIGAGNYDIAFDTENLKAGTYYMVEVFDNDEDSRWTYDDAQFKVVISGSKAKGFTVQYFTEGSDEPMDDSLPTFINTYTFNGGGGDEPVDDKVQVSKKITYSITGAHVPANTTFTFNLLDTDNEVVATATVEARGANGTQTVDFTWKEAMAAGSYKMVEVDAKAENWAYDGKEYLVLVEGNADDGFTVTYSTADENPLSGVTFNNTYTYSPGGGGDVHVTTGGGGNRSITEPETPLADLPDPEVPLAVLPEPEVPLADIPQTGVDGNVAFNMLMLGLSLGAFLAAFAGRRRKADAEQE